MTTLVPGGVAHFDISGPDAGVLQTFYQGVFAWNIQVRGPGFALVGTPEGSADGAISETEQPSLTLGILVSDLEQTLSAAVSRGGAVTMPPMDNGWVKKASITDPAGNRLTLIQDRKPDVSR